MEKASCLFRVFFCCVVLTTANLTARADALHPRILFLGNSYTLEIFQELQGLVDHDGDPATQLTFETISTSNYLPEPLGGTADQARNIPAVSPFQGYDTTKSVMGAVGGTSLLVQVSDVEFNRPTYLKTSVPYLLDPVQNDWDIVVLQEYSTRPAFAAQYDQGLIADSTDYDLFQQAVDDATFGLGPSLAAYGVDQPRVVLLNTWARHRSSSDLSSFNNSSTEMQNLLNDGYELLEGWLTAEGVTDVEIAPVGQKFRLGIDQQGTGFEDQLFASDQDHYTVDFSHPGIAGEYLAAAELYQTIWDRSPVGNTYLPAGLTQSQATSLQQLAATPEPSGFVLAGLALAGLAGYAWRRRRSTAT